MSLFARLRGNREALTVLAFSAGNALLGLLANRALTQAVVPEALGKFYLYMNLGLWLTLPSSAGFLYVLRHWGIARQQGALGHLTGWIFRGLLGQAVLAALGCAILAQLGVLSPAPWVLLALFVHSVGQAAFQLLAPVHALERRRVLSGTLDLLGQPLRQAALAGGTVLFLAQQTGEGLLGLQAVWSVLTGLIALVLFGGLVLGLRRGIPERPPGPELSASALAAYSLPFFATAVATQIGTSTERWGLARLVDPSATALFVQAVGLSTAMAGASTQFLVGYFMPIISQQAAKGPSPLASAGPTLLRFLSLVFAALCALVIFVALFAGPMTSLLFGPRYVRVAPLLLWTTLGAALFVLGQSTTYFSYVTRDSIGPNAARLLSLGGYTAMLLLLSPGENPALSFARRFAAGQALYFALVAAFSFHQVRRARAGLKIEA